MDSCGKKIKAESGAAGKFDGIGSSTSGEVLQVVREVAVTPMIAGFFQGFFTVAMRYRKERKAAEINKGGSVS